MIQLVKRDGAGLIELRRHLGVFLFAGFTGVGITKLASASIKALFEKDEAILRLYMWKFIEK